VSQNRSERQGQLLPALPVVAEVMRQCSESGKDKEKEEGRMPLFWRVFGGTVLSIAALIVMTAYQSLSGSMGELRNEMGQLGNDLRKEVNRLNETQGELVSKEELDTRMRSVWRGIRELQEDRKELIALKERCQAVVGQTKASREARQRLQEELNLLRTEQAAERQRQAMLHELAGLRERLASVEGRQHAAKAKRTTND
jgi:chromosome segregation ATPase